ncbi:hypothetical protein [Paraburkholderia sediminicola]|uniref:hypothetical protein n=1 Tax=Paraburkholderia sediminicola TaxID=458836 RepID=UPI0038B99134
MRDQVKAGSGRTIQINTPEEEAAIQRGIAQDPDNPEWTTEEMKNARPFPEVMAERRTDYRVEWSADDNQYVGLCDGFPSLSWLENTPEAALVGIHQIVEQTISELLREGEPIPQNRP